MKEGLEKFLDIAFGISLDQNCVSETLFLKKML